MSLRRVNPKSEYAVAARVDEMRRKFVYPDLDTRPVSAGGGPGKGMAHVLVVADSEPTEIQAKADYVVPSANSTLPLQAVLDAVESKSPNGPWSVWLAGIFTINGTLTVPSTMWLRGLGYTEQGFIPT